MPNRNVQPPSGAMWLEANFFPDTKQRLSWDNGACKLYTGYFQVGVGYHFDESYIDANELADAVCEHFPEGFEVGPVAVELCSSEAPVRNIDDSTQNIIPVRAYYRGLST